MAPVECVKNRKLCPASELCPSRDVWVGLEGAIRRYLEGTTLESLLVNSEEKSKTYQI
jgi:DNA-binding IscR family transcriptional regulator